MRKTLFAIFGSLTLATVASATVVVDDFTTPTAQVQACLPPGTPVSTGSLAATNTLSGERTVTVTATSLASVSGGCADAKTNFPNPNPVFTLDNGIGVASTTVISWNVAGSVNASNETLAQLVIGIDGGIAGLDTSTFTLEFCSDDACVNKYTRTWSITGQVFPPQNYIFAFSGFTVTGAPSWGNITRGSLTILSGNSSDINLDTILLNTPEPSSMLLLGSALAGFALLRRRR